MDVLQPEKTLVESLEGSLGAFNGGGYFGLRSHACGSA